MKLKALKNIFSKKCIKYVVLSMAIAVPMTVNALAAPAKGDSIVALKDSRTYKTASSSSKVGWMEKGMVRTVSSVSGNYCRVKVDGKNVWVNKKNIIETDEVVIKVTAEENCKVYTQANTSSKKLTTMYAGTTRTALAYSGNYYRIKMNGKNGWIRVNTGDFDINISVRIPEEPDAYGAIAKLAKSKIGCSYLYGGAGPNKFDASGLPYYCYTKNGITSIPRTMKAQFEKSISIRASQAEPGYLLFFDSEEKEGVVDLVGIYVGDRQFISSGRSKTGVILNSFKPGSYYDRHLIKVGMFV